MYIVPQLRLIKSFIDLVYVLDEDSRRGPSGTVEPNPRSTGEGCFFVKCASMTCAGLLGQELTAAADRLSSLN